MPQDLELDRYFTEHRTEHLSVYQQLLRIPSVSAQSIHQPDMLRAANFIADQLRAAGGEHVAVIESTGHPVVYGDWLHAEGKPTVVVYAHYDVQPAEPLELWQTPPFEPTIRDGLLFARGASDDKGHVVLHIKAFESLLAVHGELPINIKFCFEGEEETSGAALEHLLRTEPERFASDLVVISDNDILEPDLPAIYYSLRGITEFQIDVKGANSDLHSGSFGGGVPNAAQALVELLSTMHDERGHITIDGFYARVHELTADEKAQLARLPFDEEELKQRLGILALTGEAGYTYNERTTARPTLEINGIYGGYQGEGGKTVVPNEAHAKISCRLVADQDPNEILELIEAHVARYTPQGVSVAVRASTGAYPYRASLDHPTLKLAQQAYEDVYGVAPVLIRGGGSIPVVEIFSQTLHTPIVMMGFGLPDANDHAPNEHFSLTSFDRGLRTISDYWSLLSEHYTIADR